MKSIPTPADEVSLATERREQLYALQPGASASDPLGQLEKAFGGLQMVRSSK
jgi:hypothetical protein